MKLSTRLLLVPLMPALLSAQALDRTQVPTLDKPPALKLPTLERASLPNGVTLQVVQQHELPLVQLTLVIAGGTKLDGNQPGIASFTTRMLTEGAGTRDANALQGELAFLGAQLFANAGTDAFTISLNVPKRTLGEALDLLGDVVLRPTFRSADVRRQRDLRLASILQRRDNANVLASLAFNQLVFPVGHPYHRPSDGDSASTAALDSAAVRTFYEQTFVPERAKFIVVGDVTVPELRALLGRRFESWTRGTSGRTMAAVTAKPVVNSAVKIYLVDKPSAAQSVIYLGAPGAERLSPDYPALMVMNTILGGSFSSRLNANLRETKGYTYGISSRFSWAPLAGPFVVSTSVRTSVTDSSLIEIFKELKMIRDLAVDATELERAKAYVALGVPQRFETNSQIASQLVELGFFSLPLASLGDFIAKVNQVTAADVQRVARQYLPETNATLVVVGDIAKIRPGIEALKLGNITVLDAGQVAR
ncbi:MAG: insulinase family protein [Gemmatimonadaceae bacterium]|nr:insulinase family protein [Gemmatimonadaceae bacterium]